MQVLHFPSLVTTITWLSSLTQSASTCASVTSVNGWFKTWSFQYRLDSAMESMVKQVAVGHCGCPKSARVMEDVKAFRTFPAYPKTPGSAFRSGQTKESSVQAVP